ncbi:unnamed protein product [Sphenostylis stenocarpa]|uniref:Uncharacterized protein n=1 Tax=Sphenostylis stenocarpa TaxID=92480 RepID=A0AA86SBL9_9FABA|nr:unnamed protein product [Sphenostylis stenocarpa]
MDEGVDMSSKFLPRFDIGNKFTPYVDGGAVGSWPKCGNTIRQLAQNRAHHNLTVGQTTPLIILDMPERACLCLTRSHA